MSLLLPLYFRLKAPLNQELLLEEYQALNIKQATWYLVSVAGQQTDDYAQSATLQASPDLARCPYIQNILADFDFPIGRVWFSSKIDDSDETLHSCEYQAWIYVRVLIAVNDKIDLIVEIERGYLEILEERGLSLMHKHCLNLLGGGFNILEPMAFDNLLLSVRMACNQLEMNSVDKVALQQQLDGTFQAWQTTFDEFGQDSRGELIYRQILIELNKNLSSQRHKLPKMPRCALQILTTSLDMSPPAPKRLNRQQIRNRQIKYEQSGKTIKSPQFERPIFIISAPRAGSTLLFNNLKNLPELWTTGAENHQEFENIQGLHPKNQAYQSNCLDSNNVNPEVKTALQNLFSQRLTQGEQSYAELDASQRPSSIRLLEKTPKNALRIPFLKTLYPDALFIYLYREPLGNISSLVEGWRSRRFISYQNLPNWRAKDWQFLLIPGWEELNGKSLLEICTKQWASANETIIQDLHPLKRKDWYQLSYQDLIDKPVDSLKQIAEFIGVAWNSELEQLQQNLPLTTVTLSNPAPNKWRKHEQALQKARGQTQAIERALDRLINRKG